jgi:hypothetical protein
MADKDKNKETSGNQVNAGGQTFGPAEGETAAEAYPDAASAVSRDAKDYVLVEKVVGDGLRLEEQVLKSEFDEADEWSDVSLEDDNVKEAHPARNRPTSDLTEEEAEEIGRTEHPALQERENA